MSIFDAGTPNGFTIVNRWADDDLTGRYPYPDEHSKARVDGELAERIRLAFDVEDGDAPVFVQEDLSYAGYSEVTQEHNYSVMIRCAGREREFVPSYNSPAFNQILTWLDERAPKLVVSAVRSTPEDYLD